MLLKDFHIGMDFTMSNKRWRVTDIGTRTVVAVELDREVVTHKRNRTTGETSQTTRKVSYEEDPSWLNGPPYAVAERVLDEYDLPACEPLTI